MEPISAEERNCVFERFQHLVPPLAARFARYKDLTAFEDADGRRSKARDLEQTGYLALWCAVGNQGAALTKQYASAAIRNSLISHVESEVQHEGKVRVGERVDPPSGTDEDDESIVERVASDAA